MEFEKAKVTIDLEEYQFLKNKAEGMNADEYVIAAKKVIAAIISSRFDIKTARERLNRENISFSINSRGSSMIESVMSDDIIISKIKQ